MILGIIIGTVWTFLYMFLTAYISEDKQVLVSINDYNEANLEMWIVFPLVLCSSLYLIYDEFKEFKKEYGKT